MEEGVIRGSVAPGFEPVRTAFARCFRDLGETGASTAVYLDGREVANLWGGEMAAGIPWRTDTIVHTYSVTKAFAAIGLLILVDRGEVGLEDPVVRYWPEFGQAGKERTTIRQLFAHQAGLLLIEAPQQPEAIFDWQRMTALLAAEPPLWEPGTAVGEHALFYGHLVGEVVRRISGLSPGTFLRREVCEPWGIDFHIGLTPEQEARCATVTGIDENLQPEPGSISDRAIGNPPGGRSAAVVNGHAWRAAEIPAVNGHGSGRGVARLYAGLARGGELDGIRLLSEPLLHGMTSTQAQGFDRFLQRDARWGLGVQVDTDGFGMGGLGGGLGWGNTDHRFGFGYVTRAMASHDRALAVYEAAARIVGFEPVTE